MSEVKIEKREYFGNIYAARPFMDDLERRGITYWVETDDGGDKYSGICVIWEEDHP